MISIPEITVVVIYNFYKNLAPFCLSVRVHVKNLEREFKAFIIKFLNIYCLY